jgi:hypothetical protein
LKVLLVPQRLEFSLSGALFGGADEEEFFSRHWKRSFRRYPDGGRGLAEQLPTLAEVQEIISAPAWEGAAMISYLSLPREGPETHYAWNTPAPSARERGPRADESVNILDAHRWFPRLRDLALSLGTYLGEQVHAAIFLSDDGGGIRPHADVHDQFVIQIAGAKQWRVTDVDQGHPPPPAGAVELVDDPDTYDLAPGDVLYVPSLGAHCTRVLEGPSLSVTLSILRPTVADVVLGMLHDRITNDPLWSHSLPLSTSDHGQLAEALAMIAEELRDQ